MDIAIMDSYADGKEPIDLPLLRSITRLEFLSTKSRRHFDKNPKSPPTKSGIDFSSSKAQFRNGLMSIEPTCCPTVVH